MIDEASTLQDYDYVIGEVSDHGVSKNDHAHFKLIHQGGPLHCVVFASRQSRITTDIEEGMQLAVNGTISFYAPDNRCSIEVEEVDPITADSSQQSSMVPTERRQQVLLSVVILIVLVIGGALVLL